jgi:hypothetical protein
VTWPWVSRRWHEEVVAALETDALLALRMAFADSDPEGCDWSVRARALWAEVRD